MPARERDSAVRAALKAISTSHRRKAAHKKRKELEADYGPPPAPPTPKQPEAKPDSLMLLLSRVKKPGKHDSPHPEASN